MEREEIDDEDLQELRQRIAQAQQEREMASQNSPTMFSNNQRPDNLVKWQLDIKEELARIEHLLRKHVPKRDSNGNMYYAEPDEKEQLFNETGVNEILNILAWYLNKNIILSNFGEDQIKLRCSQFHQYLTDFIFNNYQRFGLDTKDKIKHYPIVVMNIVNTVEAAYYRALGGGERDSLREARQVTQSESMMPEGQQMLRQKSNNKKSIFKPWTWGR